MTVKLSENCNLVSYGSYVEINYIERAQDYWHASTETSVELDEEKAREIINLLTEHFKFNK